MPELPEVETIRRMLSRQIPGKRIEEVRFREARIFQTPAVRLKADLQGETVEGLRRRGKFLVVALTRRRLIFHLGMTGQLIFREASGKEAEAVRRLDPPARSRPGVDRHVHLQLLFSDGTALLFRDARKFGKILLLAREEDLEALFASLGLEPFSESYRLESFLERMKNRNVRIKSLLLDQGFVAGVGNIYADEALFEAGIHPLRRLRYVRKYEKERLFEAIPRVLEKGIAYGGTTLRDYVNAEGEQGTHQQHLNVYGREGELCRRCGAGIAKIVVSQRGTHFCPVCQKR